MKKTSNKKGPTFLSTDLFYLKTILKINYRALFL